MSMRYYGGSSEVEVVKGKRTVALSELWIASHVNALASMCLQTVSFNSTLAIDTSP